MFEFAPIDLLAGVAKVILGLVGLALVNWFADVSSQFDDNRLVEENSNIAVGLRKGAAFVAFGLGYTGILQSVQGNLTEVAWRIPLETGVLIILLGIAYWVTASVIMSTIDNDHELAAGNVAVGTVEAGSFLAIGLILRSSFLGEGGGLLSAVLFTFLGLVALFLLYWGYEWLTKWNVQGELKRGNLSAGITVAAQMVALAFVLYRSIAGPFTGWLNDIVSFGASAAFGGVLLLAAIWFADKFFLPHTTCDVEICRDNNTAAMALVSGAVVAIAVIASAAI